jgi:carboxylesterase type B
VQLGFLAPNGQTNLGTKDIATALRFLHEVLPSFGGAPGRITLAGQSAGGTIIRALLAAPSAEPLFQSAILLSDPMVRALFPHVGVADAWRRTTASTRPRRRRRSTRTSART